MRPNFINILVALCIAGLLAWWLGTMGITPMHKWLLGAVAGFMIGVELVLALGFSYLRPRSGSQVKLLNLLAAVATFIIGCIYSFFLFSPVAFCVPLGLLFLFDIFISHKIYRTQM